jgi:hypothetical protein
MPGIPIRVKRLIVPMIIYSAVSMLFLLKYYHTLIKQRKSIKEEKRHLSVFDVNLIHFHYKPYWRLM